MANTLVQFGVAFLLGGFQFYYAFYNPDLGPCFVNGRSTVCESESTSAESFEQKQAYVSMCWWGFIFTIITLVARLLIQYADATKNEQLWAIVSHKYYNWVCNMAPTIGWPLAAFGTRFSHEGKVAAGDFLSAELAKERGVYLISSGFFLRIYLWISFSLMGLTVVGLCLGFFNDIARANGISEGG